MRERERERERVCVGEGCVCVCVCVGWCNFKRMFIFYSFSEAEMCAQEYLLYV